MGLRGKRRPSKGLGWVLLRRKGAGEWPVPPDAPPPLNKKGTGPPQRGGQYKKKEASLFTSSYNGLFVDFFTLVCRL